MSFNTASLSWTLPTCSFYKILRKLAYQQILVAAEEWSLWYIHSKSEIMEMNWSELDVDSLRDAYEIEAAKLKSSLLNGASWDDLKGQRKKVTDLAIALHKKVNTTSNPAESADRSEKRVTR